MEKITFIGDIMCEEPLLKASRKGLTHDFSSVFAGCRELFRQSEFIVGNLETVFAGEKAGYTKELFSFNTPDTFAESMKVAGIDFVTTATNHALDRGINGLTRTLDILDQVHIDHVGAYRSENERNLTYVRKFGDIKVAFLNYTYGTNTYESPYYIPDSEYYRLNLLMPQKKRAVSDNVGVRTKIFRFIRKVIPEKCILKLKKVLRKSYVNQYTDILEKNRMNPSYLERVRLDIQKAKGVADIVIVCLHVGGQFNNNPGEQVDYFVKLIHEAGADYIINTHAHVVQKTAQIGETFIVHCLGNFSISPSSIYIPHELKPEYSIAFHLYIDAKSVVKKTFSILKIIEEKNHMITVRPVDEIAVQLSENERKSLEEDVAFIYERFTGERPGSMTIKKEYLI